MIIEASSAGVKDMADGSLRITFEFEPRHAAEAFALFGPRGRSVAIAALKDGHGAASDKPAEPEKPKGGELARLAGIWCNDAEFWTWLEVVEGHVSVKSSQSAAHCIRLTCDVKSRAELDNNPEAADKFQRLIRQPFMAWLKT